MLIAWSVTFGDNDSNFNSKHGRGGCLNPSYPTIKNLKPYSVHKIRICVRLLNKFRKVSSSIILCKCACLLDKVTQHCVSFYACALGNNERSKKEGVCGGKLGKQQKETLINHNEKENKQMSKAKEFLDYIKQSRSKSTYKSYKQGIKNFEKWLSEKHKTIDDILEMHKQSVISGDPNRIRRLSRLIEIFHKWLMETEGLSINSARTYCIPVLQFFGFYGLPIALVSQSRVSKTTISTKDFVPTIQQYRNMFNVADIRGRLIISMGLDLGWRIGDTIKLQKNNIPDLNQQTPIAFELITEKEDILAKSFLSAETVELLKTYLPTLKTDNPYLFASNGKKHLKADAINQILKNLAKKANIKIPLNKRLRFHSFRKRFISTCADLKIDINTAKILVGKSVEKSMLTYLSEVQHKKAFIEVREYLSLTNGTIKSTMQTKDVEILRLQKEVEQQRLIVKGMLEVFGEEILKKALDKIESEKDKLLAKGILTKGSATDNVQPSDLDALTQILQIVGRQREQQQREEYEKLLANNNNNNH